MTRVSRERMITEHFIVIDGEEYRENTLRDIIDGLEDSCMVGTISIYSQSIMDLLERRGVANKNIRGSCYRGKNFKAFQKELNEIE